MRIKIMINWRREWLRRTEERERALGESEAVLKDNQVSYVYFIYSIYLFMKK